MIALAMTAGAPLVVTIRVRWGDCDPAGIAFFPRFFEWMDVASEELHALLEIRRGGTQTQLARGIPLVDVQARFSSPAFVDDEIEVRSWVVRIGKSSFGLRHEFVRAADGVLLATGQESRVYVARDVETGALAPTPLTAEMREALGSRLEPSSPSP
jgi:YbgC/YbaW family acyl-CoA thioester hydrolase